MDLDLGLARFGDFDRKDVVDLLTTLEFFSMISRIPASESDAGGAQGAFDLAPRFSTRGLQDRGHRRQAG